MSEYERKIYKRKIITSPDEYIVGATGSDDTGISFESLSKAMKDYQKKSKKEGYTNFYMADRMNSDYAEDGYYSVFYSTREENDQEYNERIKIYEDRKKSKLEKK